MKGVGIIGAGRALGSHMHTNDELCSTTLRGTTPQWIVERTGIQRRFIVQNGESASGLALEATWRALRSAGIVAEQLGMIVVCTFSGEYLFPPASARLHRDLGLKGGHIFDLQANCAGFVSAATAVSDRMLLDPGLEYALVVGLEVLSPYTDYSDVETAIFFSDGAGAAVFGRVAEGCGIQSSAFFTDSSNFDSVRLRGGGSGFPFARVHNECEGRSPGLMEMNGLATWKQTVTHLPTTIRRACDKVGWLPQDVDVYIFHQANAQVITYAMQKMRVPVSRAFMNVQEIGNTGAASIPIALADALEQGKVVPGNRVVFAGVGAGFNFGAMCTIWDGNLR